MKKRLDSYGKFPSGMEEYLEIYGWHFSKNMYLWASSMFEGEKFTKEQVDELFKKHNVKVDKAMGYDMYHVANVVKNKFYKSSIDDEIHLIKFIKDYLKCYDEIAFTHFYANCIANGIPIMWEDML